MATSTRNRSAQRSGAQQKQKQKSSELQSMVEAIRKTQAVIEFKMDGTIVTANDNFLGVVGYTLGEIQGQHHSMFVEPAYKNSPEYRMFWEALNRGEHQAGEFKRIGKGGKEVWIQATYTPIMDSNGTPVKVVKFASDVSQQKMEFADYQGQIQGISEAQAVIQFNLDGTIITANDNFLAVVGYSLDEIKGQHHSIFVEPSYKNSPEYQQFWAALNRGEAQTGEFKRFGKGGKEVWIQASYTPIKDMNGTPFKVVKYATDVTKEKLINADYQGQIQAISKAQAVIQFELDGTITTANDNFLSVLGYTLDEIKGRHHSMFVEPEYKNSVDYTNFWQALNRGEHQIGEFKRLGKGGKEVWIQASYSPILDLNGKPFKVVKYAMDITAQKETLSEVGRLIEAAYNGELEERTDPSQAEGDYRKLREGINNLLDAVVGPINEAAEVMEAASNRMLNKRVNGEYKGKFAELKANINEAIQNLDTALQQVSEATEQVSSASQQIASGSQTLSQGANEQASSLEEVSSSLEEMSSQTKQNAENAQQGRNLADEANRNALGGGESMKKMVAAMSSIKDSSSATAKIVKTIDEIAMQTNLLALNAAVEAARAGEAGRGFAVVAEEVRNLAQRSAEAAKNTADMINESVGNAENGSKICEEVAKALEAIQEGNKKVNDLIAEIAAASDEQSKGIDQVNTAVAEMDKVTQQNAANSEESASSAEELSSQAEELQSMVAQFELSVAGNGSKKAAVAKPATARTTAAQGARQGGVPQKAAAGHNGGNGNGRKKMEAVAAAREAIPMDDEEALKEF